VTDRVWLGSLLGVLFGAVMQSVTAVTVILASMTASRMISVRQALPVVAWTNVGATLLVFVAVLNIKLAVLYLVGLAGISFTFSKEVRWKTVFGVALGIGLLLYGIDTMKASAGAMQQLSWFQAVMSKAQGSYLIAFAAAVFLSFLTQSTTAVVMIAVALMQSRLLASEETIMVIYGGNLGSTFARMILAGGLQGSAKQIGRFQDFFKIGGAALFVTLFYVEEYGQVPLVHALVRAATDQVQTQMALVNLLFNVGMAVLVTPLRGPIERLLIRLWPATAAEDFGRFQYFYPEALSDPETALDLMEKEQARLLRRVPGYLNFLRPAPESPDDLDFIALHQAFTSLGRELESYITSLVDVPHTTETSERLMHVKNRQGLIGYVEYAVFELAEAIHRSPPSGRLAPLVWKFLEAIDLLLGLTADACGDPAQADFNVLETLCGDRGELMGTIRKRYLAGETELAAPEKALLFGLTAHFERIVWLTRRLGRVLEQRTETA
jgi:phosphate:Na+ symporter